eukprot:scpid25962/ scgid13165/ 
MESPVEEDKEKHSQAAEDGTASTEEANHREEPAAVENKREKLSELLREKMVAKKHFTNARRTLLVRSMNGGVRGEQANDELAELSSHYDNATSAIMNLVSLYSSTNEEKRIEVTLREAELLEEQFTTTTESILEDVRGQVRSYAEETDYESYLGVSQRPHPVQARRELASEVGYGYSGPAAST